MFRAWTFTEMPYPYLPPEDTYESLRVDFPSAIYDPEVGYQLYKTYFDLYKAADELGLDIMLNEHHATATCVAPAVPLTLAALARDTKNARLLALGNPIANRNTPVRVAEEMAMIDVMSHGRLDVGFVRGVPYEISPGNVQPVEMKERFWEGADLILKAWQTHDGPFNWEGRYYHHRQVNVWPRVYQDPHPPVWVATQSTGTSRETAERGFNLGTILAGADGALELFKAYRDRAAEDGLAVTPRERLGYVALVFVGDTDEAGFAGANKLRWYLEHNKIAPQFMNVPGYIDARVRARILQNEASGKPLVSPIEHLVTAPLEKMLDEGYVFAGSPDTVYAQLERFYRRVGGFGNFIMMVQSGTMGYDLVEHSMELFAREVLPRFRANVYDVDTPVAAAAA
ncbi:MAG TPA: LLM class flavin-dependent oxidoreductase [Asanoa sp.]|jgi:alkanesulfonate monooxygenase SsuD/methylene tetrahydromethanopterin reductase-like flavin-dependent oxidoreductase (luciferase family)|nr:LLM class flavin-dependent oxidoreductase [Asanoa sp.]